MKKTILTLAVAALACSVVAQGRISFNNDSLHLVYFNPDSAMLAPADAALAGQVESGLNLVADLYVGTSSTALALLAETTFGPVPGEWNASNVTLLAPGGTTLYFQVAVHSIEGIGVGYSGNSVVFSGAPSGPLNSKLTDFWPVGSYPLPGGGRGAIMLSYAVPEPSTAALWGLGVLALGLCRRGRRG